jgi:hydrogenase maturation protease
VLRKGDGGEGEIAVEFLSLGGISLMEHLIGYERAIIIDALASDQPNGSVIVSKLSELADYSALHITSAHDTSLQNALKLGKAMGANLPDDVTIVGIATDQVYEFGEELSSPVEDAIPRATKIVIDLL